MGGCASKSVRVKFGIGDAKVMPTDLNEPLNSPELKEHKWKFENLVIEGNSTNGTVTVGAYKVLHQLNIIKKIKKFAGSSSGSMLAAFAAVRMPPSMMVDAFIKVDMSTFKDDSMGILRDSGRLLTEFGLYKGNVLQQWVESVLEARTGVKNITFKQVMDKYGSELYVTIVNLEKMAVEYVNPTDNPDAVVSEIVRQSMSIPFVFRSPVNNEGHHIIDGGVGDNYPLDLFDGGSYNKKTIGIKVMSQHATKSDEVVNRLGFEINSLDDFMYAFVTFQALQIERSKIDANYWTRTIALDSPNRPIQDFNISMEDKYQDLQSGMNTSLAALAKHVDVGHF
jgi:predicted acylesterase/phospholipase RssA